jgi:hypothetical protein
MALVILGRHLAHAIHHRAADHTSFNADRHRDVVAAQQLSTQHKIRGPGLSDEPLVVEPDAGIRGVDAVL